MSQRSRRSLSISGVASSTEAPLAARKAVADDQGDIFSNHGGKMVVGFLSMVGALVYRSMQGTSNADHLQGKVRFCSAVFQLQQLLILWGNLLVHTPSD